jgi:hypothetical protein
MRLVLAPRRAQRRRSWWIALAAGACGASWLACGAPPSDTSARVSSFAEEKLVSDDAAAAPSSCLRGALDVSVDPVTSDPVSAHTTVVYDAAVSAGDSDECDARLLFFEPGARPANFSFFVDPPLSLLAPGRSSHFILSVTGTTDDPPGVYSLPFQIIDATTGSRTSARVEYVLRPPADCLVRPDRELLLRDPSVVDDPLRTRADDASRDPRQAVWTFGRLMEAMAPTPDDAPAMVERFFRTWLDDQVVNGFEVPARPAIDATVLQSWPRRADGSLDLSRSPLRLLAIVNRMDLADLAHGSAGEGRFVFGVLDPGGFSTLFTIIFEYRLPARNDEDLRSWARAWHRLGALPFPSEQFNAHLQAITDRFARRGRWSAGVNGSALSTIRTNEAALDFLWELRSFELSATDGFLHQVPVDLTPDIRFLDSTTLADFINENEPQILSGHYQVPPRFAGEAFEGGSALNLMQAWTAPSVRSPQARRAFAINTCNGCHSSPETSTEFLHIGLREPGMASQLSGFLLGIAVPDSVTGDLMVFNDLQRRQAHLEQLVCGCDPAADVVPP